MADAYHHGNLRAAVLEKAAEVIESQGPYGFSLRSLAADLGVSHTAPRHHFGSREGVLNALAVEGFQELAESLRGARAEGGTLLDAGVAYVRFAVDRPGHFQVMFAPRLLAEDDAELATARGAAFAELTGGVDTLEERGIAVEDSAAAVVAGWAIVHGIATLALNGNLDTSGVRALFADTDLLTITRRSAGLLFDSASGQGSA